MPHGFHFSSTLPFLHDGLLPRSTGEINPFLPKRFLVFITAVKKHIRTISTILSIKRQRQDNCHKFKACLVYIVSFSQPGLYKTCLKNKNPGVRRAGTWLSNTVFALHAEALSWSSNMKGPIQKRKRMARQWSIR